MRSNEPKENVKTAIEIYAAGVSLSELPEGQSVEDQTVQDRL
jgi:hypothetical protein